MRKYFLISTVALMTATNVNAIADSGTVQVKAQVNMVNTMSCSAMDFGTIYLKAGNAFSTLSFDDTFWVETTGDIISYSQPTPSTCTLSGEYDSVGYDLHILGSNGLNIVELNGGTGEEDGESGMSAWIDEIGAQVSTSSGLSMDLYGKLNIPANFTGGSLTGSFTVMIVQ